MSTNETLISAAARKDQSSKERYHEYEAPEMFIIGQSASLLQGSGRHKNDDTGSRGFSVDQH